MTAGLRRAIHAKKQLYKKVPEQTNKGEHRETQNTQKQTKQMPKN